MNRPLSRREFCAVTGAGLLTLPLAGCGGGGGPLLDGGTDMAQAPSDMANPCGPSCGAGSSLCGAKSAGVATDQAQFDLDGHFYVCRDAQGLYALTSICTHNGCDVGFVSSAQGFSCPCHGSQYDFNGAVTLGPARLPLDHLALCVSAEGEVFVDPNTTVPAGTRTQG